MENGNLFRDEENWARVKVLWNVIIKLCYAEGQLVCWFPGHRSNLKENKFRIEKILWLLCLKKLNIFEMSWINLVE